MGVGGTWTSTYVRDRRGLLTQHSGGGCSCPARHLPMDSRERAGRRNPLPWGRGGGARGKRAEACPPPFAWPAGPTRPVRPPGRLG